MNHRKWVHNFFFYTLVSVGFVLIALMAVSDAHASGRDNDNDNDPPPFDQGQDQEQDQGQAQGQGQGQYQGQNASGEGYASAEGTGTATNEGNNNLTENNSLFLNFSNALPSAGECFGAVQGGGGDGSGGGFLGWRPLNKPCWLEKLAEAEENIQIRARLKCGSEVFADAVSYDEPKFLWFKSKKRQRACIKTMVDVYGKQVAWENKKIQDMLTAQTLIISDHVTTATERTTDTLTRVVETCSDCYGEKLK